MIKLTDEEIGVVDIHCGMSEIDGSEPFTSYKYEHHLLKAQLKKVGEWGNKPCPHDPWVHDDAKRAGCKRCWQTLLEEVEE